MLRITVDILITHLRPKGLWAKTMASSAPYARRRLNQFSLRAEAGRLDPNTLEYEVTLRELGKEAIFVHGFTSYGQS